MNIAILSVKHRCTVRTTRLYLIDRQPPHNLHGKLKKKSQKNKHGKSTETYVFSQLIQNHHSPNSPEITRHGRIYSPEAHRERESSNLPINCGEVQKLRRGIVEQMEAEILRWGEKVTEVITELISERPV